VKVDVSWGSIFVFRELRAKIAHLIADKGVRVVVKSFGYDTLRGSRQSSEKTGVSVDAPNHPLCNEIAEFEPRSAPENAAICPEKDRLM
jgi:hypothetical protein